MIRIYYFFLFFFFFIITGITAQTYTTKELIKIWKDNGLTQTIKAEEIREDLYLNFNQEKCDAIVTELYRYLDKRSDMNLAIRIKMFHYLANSMGAKGIVESDKEELKELVKEAIAINNQQLLSEIYTLYAEIGPGSIEDKLFYNTQAVEIQEGIGVQYFPKLYIRYYILSRSYYSFEEYDKSIFLGKKCMELLRHSEQNISVYNMQLDILGQNYLEKKMPDSALRCYLQIKEAIGKYDVANIVYKKAAKVYGNGYAPIWEGVVKGGVAKALLLTQQYDEAVALLEDNLISSMHYKQWGDVVKAGNLLADAYWLKGNINKAIELWKEAYSIEAVHNYSNIQSKLQVSALKKIMEAYRQTGEYDSAAVYMNNYMKHREVYLNMMNQSRVIDVDNKLQYERIKTTLQQSALLLQQQKATRNILLVVAMLLLSIVFFLYNRYRLKQSLQLARAEQQRISAESKAEKLKINMRAAKQELDFFKQKLIQNSTIVERLINETKSFPDSVLALREASLLTDEDWDRFKSGFMMVYPLFLTQLKKDYPTLSPAEIRYLCLVKLGLDQKQIAAALGISPASLRVTWYRLRVKLALEKQITPDEFIKNMPVMV